MTPVPLSETNRLCYLPAGAAGEAGAETGAGVPGAGAAGTGVPAAGAAPGVGAAGVASAAGVAGAGVGAGAAEGAGAGAGADAGVFGASLDCPQPVINRVIPKNNGAANVLVFILPSMSCPSYARIVYA